MSELVCVSESVYRDALTRGRRYTVLTTDEEKRQVRIKGDNGRIRWFPTYCFDQSSRDVPTLVSYQLDDPIELAEELPIEVTVQLSNNERRWCIFATPTSLATNGDRIEGTEIPFHYGNGHVIIAAALSEALIERMLHYIDSQDELLECTLPLSNGDDESETSED